MIKKISVLSRNEIEYIIDHSDKFDHSWALISIHCEHELISSFKIMDRLKELGCEEFLSIDFADIEQQIAEFVLFNDGHAEKIINFINKHSHVDHLVIHCAAGISRSGAVGVFACRYLNLDEKDFRKTNKNILPNMHVLSTLTRVAGLNKNYVEFWENHRRVLRKRVHKIKFSTSKSYARKGLFKNEISNLNKDSTGSCG